MAVSMLVDAPNLRRSDRIFYGGMACAVLALVFVGFSRTFYLASYFHGPALSRLRVVHGTLFSSWVLLFGVQTALISTRRVRLHRILGYAGAVLAVAMIGVGVTLAIESAREGKAPPGLPPLAFMIIPIFDMIVFAPLVAAGVYFRRSAEMHKRLMLLATVSLLSAAAARVTGTPGAGGPLVFFGTVDLLILLGVIYDRRTRGHVHPAYKWGGSFIVGSQVARLALMMTPAWMAIARALTGV